MTPNKRDLKAYSRFDGTGRIVPGSTVLRRNKPKNGKWKEVQAYECCDTFTPCKEPLIMQILPWNIGPGIYEFAFGMRVYNSSNTVKGTIEWGDGTSESFDLSGTSGTSYIFHDYTANQFTPQTVKVYFTSVAGFRRLEIGQGDLTGDLLSVSNLQGVFKNSAIQQVDADEQDNLVSLDVSNLPIEQLYALGCPNLHYVNVSGCTNLIDVELFEDDIYQLDFTGCTSLYSVAVYQNTNMDTLIIDGCPNLFFLDATFCTLLEDTVNNILINLDNNGLTGGQVYLDGGSNASPTGDGITAVNNLNAKGWNVSTN